MASLVSVKLKQNGEEGRHERPEGRPSDHERPRGIQKAVAVSVVNMHVTLTDDSQMEWTGVTAAAGPWLSRHRLVSRPLSDPPHSYMVLAVVSVLCACPIGLGALYWSLKSMRYARRGDYWRARSGGRNALAFSVASHVLGVFTVIVLVILAVTSTI